MGVRLSGVQMAGGVVRRDPSWTASWKSRVEEVLRKRRWISLYHQDEARKGGGGTAEQQGGTPS